MLQHIHTVAHVAEQIAAGKTLLLAGEETLLSQLPQGNWIGGTSPYINLSGQAGLTSRDKIFVNDISAIAKEIQITTYSKDTLANVYADTEGNGFHFIIIPGGSVTHTSFALNGPNYTNFASKPLVGWISGVHPDMLSLQKPKVFHGQTKQIFDQDAVVMHVSLIPGKTVDAGIINIFEQGDGDILTFPTNGFVCSDVVVNGVTENFAHYIERTGLDLRLPLVADYYGAMINISFQHVDMEQGLVSLYAPVFTGVRYKYAKRITDYVAAFTERIHNTGLSSKHMVFSCNCVLNYLELESKNAVPFIGPITFGEIAYQLLNQTMVYLTIHDA
ncbi:hypothetical protein MASR1M90_14460 [Desulfovibrionales bacterium]